MGAGIVPKSKTGTLEANVPGHKGRTTRAATRQSYAEQGSAAAPAGAVKKVASNPDFQEQAEAWKKHLHEEHSEADQEETQTTLIVEDTLSKQEEEEKNLFLNPRNVSKRRFSWTIWRHNIYMCLSNYFPFKTSYFPSRFLK